MFVSDDLFGAVAAAVFGVHPLVVASTLDERIRVGFVILALLLPLLVKVRELVKLGTLLVAGSYGMSAVRLTDLFVPRHVAGSASIAVLGLALLIGALLRPASARGFSLLVIVLGFVSHVTYTMAP